MSRKWAVNTLGVLLGMALLVGCNDEQSQDGEAQKAQPQQAAAQQMPPPKVGVVKVEPQAITLFENLPGRLEASREAVVRARVDGIIEQRVFGEGAKVKAGDLLYKIDDDMYRAAVASAEAQKAQAVASRNMARSTVQRYAPLVKAKAISRQQYEQARSEEQVAQANINAAQAAIHQAKIRLDYANVVAPIDGRIGKALATEGSLVSAAQGTELARIQQTNPLNVSISQSASKMMMLKRALAEGSVQQAPDQLAVDILLDDGTPYPQKGKLLFSDQTVDPSTGEITLQAEVPNPDDLLLPGLYVRVKLPTVQLNEAFLVPQQAVTRGDKGNTVLVVNEDNTFAPRLVSIEQAQGNRWVVTSGLKAGDTVIVDGQMGLRGATKVNPVPWQGDAQGNAQGQAADASKAQSAPDKQAAPQSGNDA